MAGRAAKRTVYHITPAGGDADMPWQVERREGRREVSEPHRTQKEAIDAARRQAEDHKPAQVVVHGRDGRIRTEYTYGDDPRRFPG
ncbi:DUF2188 domain-containing protein [Streptomyces sp. 2P-4]|uniref:DUF2188 domain-containing protein n=1 Tax=Streptomyces sp. 2P-4 TaxID=2931974 RepID=UPI002540D44E|nr:DUF2188 domain-containing protein [Streptomyces sp. 2P-4]